MFNYFKKLVTGYSTVKRQLSGVECRYLYSGKPVFFDPFLMIREFMHRAEDKEVQHLPLKVPKTELVPLFSLQGEQDAPSVICTCTHRGNELKVSRFTGKDGLHPFSYYHFEMNGTSFGHFRRKYDYGAQLPELAQKLSNLNQSPLDNSRYQWFFTSTKGEQVFLEKFGHTQIWYFTDSEKLNIWRIS
ncbi:hypothetical protein [Algoriphagus sp. AK58]|uniref:hypothetical protein n=1 Tax=Algoriphagus sp. AK58 TaxID=1406877 RepID=UPI0016506B1E|nr:hypothetical protein [Algoriphagus sp. AK58]